MSILKKCTGDPASIMPLENIGAKDSLSYEEVVVEIFDKEVRKWRNKDVTLVKVLWKNNQLRGATLEAKVDIMTKYPQLTSNSVPA